VIEDLPLLYNIPTTVDLPVSIRRVILVPGMQELPVCRDKNKISVTIPQFACHCAVVFEY
jgi:hypothetical protein